MDPLNPTGIMPAPRLRCHVQRCSVVACGGSLVPRQAFIALVAIYSTRDGRPLALSLFSMQ